MRYHLAPRLGRVADLSNSPRQTHRLTIQRASHTNRIALAHLAQLAEGVAAHGYVEHPTIRVGGVTAIPIQYEATRECTFAQRERRGFFACLLSRRAT